MTSYAIVLTHNRPELLHQCLAAISPQVDRVHVVDNASNPPMRKLLQDWPLNVVMYEDSTQPPNLSRMWNAQLSHIARIEQAHSSPEWEVAVLCDDAIAPSGWFSAASEGMRKFGAAAGCTHAINPVPDYLVKYAPDGDIWNRMCGWAFVLAGEKGLRADESMHWWWTDTSIDFESRLNGGMVVSPGPVVPNILPNAWTNAKAELSEQAGKDRLAFAVRWGTNPW